MAERTDRLFNVLAVTAVLISATAVAQRIRPQLFGQVRPAARSQEPVEVKDWQSYAATGHRMGPVNASVTILEFGDFECPACKRFTTTSLSVIRARYPNDVAVVFRHWPLTDIHKFAYPAARAAECAGAQGKFDSMHDILYAKQDSLGLKPFAEYAKESGVPDLKAFAVCDSSREKILTVETDAAAAKAIGGTGTPTLVINGKRYPGGIDSTRLDALVKEALQARK